MLQIRTGTRTNHYAMPYRPACAFDVVANLCTEATNLLKFCMACSDGLDLPLGAGVSDVGCDAGEGRI